MTRNDTPIRISDTVALPLDFVTSTQAIVAKKRVGKTYTAQVEAEELLAAKQQVVVLDPTDAWWGLRSSADGASPGYPITIFGGRHADLPLAHTAGAEMADAIVADKFSAVLSLKLFTKGERLRFAADFLETLYRENTEAMHLFIDEADAFVPQKTWSPEQARCLGAADELVRRGGIDGVGITLITQRSAVINKDVLSQIDRLIVLRMNYPLDIKAIKDWIAEHVDVAKAKEMLHSLPSLPKGEAWMWSPDTEQFERLTVRRKRTFDSGRTPKAGERRAEPKVLAQVDLERLGQRIAATVERAKANDPKVLKARIAELEKERIATRNGGDEVVKLQIKADALLKQRDEADERTGKLIEERAALQRELDIFRDLMKDVADDIDTLTGRNEAIKRALKRPKPLTPEMLGAMSKSMDPIARGLAAVEMSRRDGVKLDGYRERVHQPFPDPAPINGGRPYETANGLPAMETRMLTALAQHPEGLTKPKLLLHADYAAGGATSRCFAKLVSEGWATGDRAGSLTITSQGLAVLGDYRPLPTGRDLQTAILTESRLSDMEKSLLTQICEAYPHTIGKRDVLDKAGYAAGGATSRAFARLVAFDYVKAAGPSLLVAAEELFG